MIIFGTIIISMLVLSLLADTNVVSNVNMKSEDMADAIESGCWYTKEAIKDIDAFIKEHKGVALRKTKLRAIMRENISKPGVDILKVMADARAIVPPAYILANLA